MRRSCGRGPGRGATGRPGRGRRNAAPRAPASPGSRPGRVYCGYSSSPSANDSSVRRLVVAHHAGHEPTDRLEHDHGGHLAARRARSRRRRARRRRGGRAPARRPPRSGRTAARSRPAPRAASRPSWSKRSATGAEQEQRPRRSDRLDCREERLGHQHHARVRRRTASRRPSDAGRSRPTAGRARAGREAAALAPVPNRLCDANSSTIAGRS